MARTGSKKKDLTPEEKLAQALVPVEEQPYEVPENWCWVRLYALLEASKEKMSNFSNQAVNYIGLEHMEKDAGIVSCGMSSDIKSTKNVFFSGQILYGKLRPYLNKHGIAEFNGVCSTDILVFDAKETVAKKYANYYFDHQFFLDYAVSNSKGINLPRVSESVILDAPCPLPPLPEQQRIVARIESLFAKLDEAKEKAQAVVDGFEERKAAILHKAFTGELTKEWRKEVQKPDTWINLHLENIIDRGPQNGLYKPKTAYGTGVKILRIDGFYDGNIESWESLKRLSLNDDECKLYQLYIGDIVINRVNSMPYLGKSALIREMPELCVFESNMMRIIIDNNQAYPEYVIRFLNSPIGLSELRKNAKQAVNQASINQQDVKNVIIPIPSLEEQQQIIIILSSLLDKQQQAKSAAEQVLDQIDTMKKAILARAFRGELGTNDPAEESAVEMVRRAVI